MNLDTPQSTIGILTFCLVIKHFEKSLDIRLWQTPIASLFHGFISHMVHYSGNNYAIIHFLIVFSNTLNFHEFSKIVWVETTPCFIFPGSPSGANVVQALRISTDFKPIWLYYITKLITC